MKYKLLIIDSHPIQYRVPLFQRLARYPQIDLRVCYCSNIGVTEYLDKGFGLNLKWDIPLLEGYRYEFLNNYSLFPPTNKPWGLFNPSVLSKLKKRKYDAVLIYGYLFLTNWLVSLAYCLREIPVILAGETLLFRRPGFVKKSLLRLFLKNIQACLYEGNKSLEFYKYFKISEKELFFLPCCVNNDFFITEVDKWQGMKEIMKRDNSIPRDFPVILYASKLIPRKRPLDLLKAFTELQTKAALIFVGDGELKPSLRDYADKHQIKNVFFPGFKNQSELPYYYAIADMFVLPSAYEPWGLVINEAMCAKLPIITTDKVAAAYDLVKEGKNGYVLKVGDIESLRKSLEILVLEANRRSEMGSESFKIISGWNYDLCIQGIIKALEFVNKP
jgi:glycosyltransferase involved in cell wall biosynthesis